MLALAGSAIIAIGALLGIYFSNQASLRQAQRQVVAPKYAEILQVIWDVANPPKEGPLTESAIAERYFTITRTLAVWGSDRSVCAWRDWRKKGASLSEGEAKDPTRLLDEFDGLLRVIREEMGHANVGIAPADETHFGDLIGLMLTEAERPGPEASAAEQQPSGS